ncbi:MAG: hypothetical protein FWE91_12330 [Defluviitaleaceae bacterium]|nr:hypothetical protein [Defluviitaleaceae bacterium]
MFPFDESVNNADFREIYNEFKIAVRNKDLQALDGFIDEEILISFDDGIGGKDDFYGRWSLNDEPEESELWAELEIIINLGGYFCDDNFFVAPYNHWLFKL